MNTDIIYNEDCIKGMKNLPDKCVDLVIIDPPYKFDNGSVGGTFGLQNRNYHQKYLDLCRGTGNGTKITSNSRMLSKGFDNEILNELVRIMKKINIYIWCSKAQLRQIIDYFDDLNCNIDLLTWHKTNPTPMCNETYLSDTEYLIFAKEKGVILHGNYHTKKKFWVTPTNKEDKKKWKHPTIKPLQIIENLIINSSKENDVVLDCFIGSGTTAVACINTNRHYIGYEIDKNYFEIAENRINETKKEKEEKNK